MITILLPKPKQDESRDNFVARFMSNEQAKKDFPQALAKGSELAKNPL